ncbi:hypothetical protein E2C01_047985 [Portunus trituberculatus]|uniref:Uncharacterized protein n=1 Tax=Portunus trituberculatus TaxID=210409 RepID=A0A5B7GAB3_PORTR|nr:hypothetical protein [Portunus trituberculatus]
MKSLCWSVANEEPCDKRRGGGKGGGDKEMHVKEKKEVHEEEKVEKLVTKQAMLVRQLEDELRHQKARGLSVEVQSQLENLSTENDHLTREVAILRETIKVSTRRLCSPCRR